MEDPELQHVDLVVLDESFAALDPSNLQRALRCVHARARAESLARRANTTFTLPDMQAALAAAQEVDHLWQQYGRRWRALQATNRPPNA